jgi:hypothetical protein
VRRSASCSALSTSCAARAWKRTRFNAKSTQELLFIESKADLVH